MMSRPHDPVIPRMDPKPTLALADDDDAHAELLSTWLRLRGFEVVRFPSGDELVSWASATEGSVDAFVLDVDMPGRDGFQSCRELRALPTYASTPTVFVTSLAGEGPERQAASAGGDAMIRKDAQMLGRLTLWLDNLFPRAHADVAADL